MSGRSSAALSRRTVLMAAATAFTLPLLGCTARDDAAPLLLAAGEPGGLYLQFGELLRDALRHRGGPELEVLTTNGSVANLAMLADRSARLAISLADSAIDALGQGADLVALGRVYQNYLQCVVRAGTDIRSLQDLRGRAISIGALGSGSSLTTSRLLAANDLIDAADPPIIGEYPLEEATAALSSGALDAFFWSGGVPTARIHELRATTPIRLLDLSSAFDPLNRAFPHTYSLTEVPTGV